MDLYFRNNVKTLMVLELLDVFDKNLERFEELGSSNFNYFDLLFCTEV